MRVGSIYGFGTVLPFFIQSPFVTARSDSSPKNGQNSRNELELFGVTRVAEKSNRSWVKWLVVFGIWTVIGLSFGLRAYFQAQFNGAPLTVSETIVSYLIDFYYWAAASPILFETSRRYPVERGAIISRAFFYIALSIVVIPVVTALTVPTTWYLGLINQNTFPTIFVAFYRWMISPFMIHQGVMAYWGTVLAAHGYNYYRQVQAAKIRASELTAQLAQAQLAALQMQINPHFLFNTLNSIASLIHKDVEAADLMIARLSDFLRATLKASDRSVITIEEEIEFLNTYLEIEKIRFQDRLEVNIEILGDAGHARVPRLILQPLVENAIRHGVGRTTAIGQILITAGRDGSRLNITIEDNGPGFEENNSKPTAAESGIGLANTRERLAKFYEDFEFAITKRNGLGGTSIKITIPFLA